MTNLDVICVDNDEFTLKAVGKLIRQLRPEWEMLLVCEPMRWKSLWEQSEINNPAIVISALMMPQIRGDELLQDVKHMFPESIRVLLTRDTAKELPQKAQSYAHFVLPKPFVQEDFEHLFSCAERLHQIPFSVECRRKLGLLSGIPVLPNTVNRIQKIIALPNCDMYLIADAVSHEPSLVARVFQIANSSYFGFQRKTDSLPEAISRLGVSLVEVVAVSLLTNISHKRVTSAQHKQIADRSLKVGYIAKLIAKNLGYSVSGQDKVFVASLLTSIGTLLVMEEGASLESVKTFLNLHEGYCDNHVVAAYLLILWGYGIDIGDIILNQNRLNFSSDKETEIFGSIARLADLVALQKTRTQLEALAKRLPESIGTVLQELIPLFIES
jgi:HD-like signal output (HDOD) protein